MLSEHVERLIALAIEEDVGRGDITTEALISQDAAGEAFFLAKEAVVVCGNEVAEAVFRRLDPCIEYAVLVGDGSHVQAGGTIALVRGKLHAILAGERTALNFLQRLSAISTKAHALSKVLRGSGVRLLDTRKTTPGMRELEKFAVRNGGGVNHRQGLFDAVLIKNNHVDAVGGDVRRAVEICRSAAFPGVFVEVEVRNQAELDAALAASPDVIMLDNYSPDALRQAVSYVREERKSAVALEASGGITEENLAEYAVSGLTYVSMGSLTHSVHSADIALRLGRPTLSP